jgi:serine/threonine protein kinase
MEIIGKYKLIRVIGEGGMGRVYEALDPIIGRRVAIKTISINVMSNPEAHARFFREAQAAGQLSHPNLITIHDVAESEGTPYIVMEYLEGLDLNHKIRQERLSYDTKMQIMIDVCQGLAFAHGHGIIHRDIKPANVFVTTQGRVKILDFGLARGALSDITQTGKIMGTPNYMAPEQIRGDDVDHRADIFATGVVFYELLSGRKAFEGDSVATTIYKVLQTNPTPLHQIDEQLPSTLSAIIERALAKDRVERFQSSSELLEAILQADGRTTAVERSRLHTAPLRPPTATTTAPAKSRGALVAGLIMATVAFAGVIGFAVWSRSSRDRQPPAPIAQEASTPRAAPSAPPPEPPAPAPAPAPPPPPPATAVLPATSGATATKGTPKPPPPVERPARREAPTAVVPPPAPPATTSVAPATTSIAPTPPPAADVPLPPEPRPAPPAEPPRAVTPPVAPPAPPPAPVAPPAAPPARVEEATVPAVQAVLARYRTALESRDIAALKRLWPALGGRQEEALRTEFERARGISVGLDGVDIRPSNGGATVTCRRTYTVMTGDGQTLRTTTTMFMTLARHDGAWSIESIRHEVAR